MLRVVLALLSVSTAVSLSGCLVTTVVGAAVDVTETAVKTVVEVPIAVGRAVAAAIPGAELVLIEGMGHDLPPGLWDQLADCIVTNISVNT